MNEAGASVDARAYLGWQIGLIGLCGVATHFESLAAQSYKEDAQVPCSLRPDSLVKRGGKSR